MDTTESLVRQHLIDPEQCIRCGGCQTTCAKSAVAVAPNFSSYAIDPDRCDACLECMDACSTGAIDSWRYVPENQRYTVEMQLEWRRLPLETFADSSLRPPRILHGPPPSAAAPKVMLSTPEKPALSCIVENRRLCMDGADSDIRHLVLQTSDAAYHTLEGQSLGVLPPGADDSGQPHAMRIYSIASTRNGEQGEAGRIALTVKRVTEDYEGRPVQGLCSNYLCDLQPGEIVRLVGPLGNSYLMPDDPDTRLLMICTGTGIAPMRGMIERRKQMRSATKETLHFYIGARTVGELPYREELHAAADAGLIDLHIAYSRQRDVPRRYVQDLLAEKVADLAAALADPRTYIYICGLRTMESGVMDVFRNASLAPHLDWDQVHVDLRTQHRLHIEVY